MNLILDRHLTPMVYGSQEGLTVRRSRYLGYDVAQSMRVVATFADANHLLPGTSRATLQNPVRPTTWHPNI